MSYETFTPSEKSTYNEQGNQDWSRHSIRLLLSSLKLHLMFKVDVGCKIENCSGFEGRGTKLLTSKVRYTAIMEPRKGWKRFI